MEKRGIPAATVAVEQLARTVGVSMAAAHGIKDYPIAMVPTGDDIASSVDSSFIESIGGQQEVTRLARDVVSIWLSAALPSAPVKSQGDD